MYEFKVISFKSIGPAKLGMSREQIREVLGVPYSIEEAEERSGINWPDTDYYFRNALRVSYNDNLMVDNIEISSEPDYVVTFEGMSVLEVHPDAVIMHLKKYGEIDESYAEYPVNIWIPSLCLNLFRTHSVEDKFDTIGICTLEFANK